MKWFAYFVVMMLGLIAQAHAVPNGTGGHEFPLGSDAGDDFIVDSTKLVVEGDTGEVGIGTNSPDADLDIEGAENTELIRLTDSTNTDSAGIFVGSGTPESQFTAQLGSLYIDHNAGNLYRKASGDGTNTGWKAMIAKDEAGRVLLETQTASNDSTIDFTSGIDSTYSEYILEVIKAVPATDAVYPRLRVSVTAVGDFEDDAGDYAYANDNIYSTSGGGFRTRSNSADTINLGDFDNSGAVGSDTGESVSMTITMYGPTDTAAHTHFVWLMNMETSGGQTAVTTGAAQSNFTTAIDGLRFYFSSGNVESGTFKLYGLQSTVGADIAEEYYTQDLLAPGTVVSMDVTKVGWVQKTQVAYDPLLIGVVSTKPGYVLTGDDIADKGYPVDIALAGRVPVRVSGENGAIEPGDYLSSSSKPGVAMKATRAGSVIGRALSAFKGNSIQDVGDVILFLERTQTIGFLGKQLRELERRIEEVEQRVNF